MTSSLIGCRIQFYLNLFAIDGVGKKSLSTNGGGAGFNIDEMLTSALASNPKILYAPNGTDADVIIDEVRNTYE